MEVEFEPWLLHRGAAPNPHPPGESSTESSSRVSPGTPSMRVCARVCLWASRVCLPSVWVASPNGSKAATTALRCKVHLHAGCDDISRTRKTPLDASVWVCVCVCFVCESQTPIDNTHTATTRFVCTAKYSEKKLCALTSHLVGHPHPPLPRLTY